MLTLNNQTGVLVGTTYQSRPDERTHIPVQFDLTAGTATVVIEGRVSADRNWVVLATMSASDIVVVARCPQMRARATAATGASGAVSAGAVLYPAQTQ